MRIGFFPNMGKSNIMAVLKMAAHICKDEGIEVFLPDDLESDAPARVLKIPETHILSRPEIFKQIDKRFVTCDTKEVKTDAFGIAFNCCPRQNKSYCRQNR